jgi:hypothetical protein
VANDHELAPLADRLDDGVGIVPPPGRGVLAREVDGDGIMPALP